MKKHDKKHDKNQLARTAVPTMLSMPFLQMKGLQGIIAGLVKAYGMKPLDNMAQRVDELLGIDTGDAEDSDEGEAPTVRGSTEMRGSLESTGDNSKYHPEVVESQMPALAMQSKRMKTGFRSMMDKTGGPSSTQPSSQRSQLPSASVEELNEKFEISDVMIGKGSFGQVFLAREKRKPESKIAAKVIPTRKIGQVVAEVEALSACQGCVHVVALCGKGVYDVAENSVAILTELCDKELYDMVVSDAPLSQGRAHGVFTGLIGGIAHIHNCGYCHRDIKLENILLKGKVIKICDFGFAAPHSHADGSVVMTSRQCGSLVYASPQSYHGQQYDGRTTAQ